MNSSQGANRSKGSTVFQNKEQSARKRLESLKTRSKPFQGKYIISEEGANRLEETREFRERVENFRRGSKPLERQLRFSRETRIFESKEQTARKELESFRRSSKPLETD